MSNYNLFSWTDANGKTQNFMCRNEKVFGGEAIIYFGFMIDDQGRIANEEIAVRSLMLKPLIDKDVYQGMARSEIQLTKVLYKNTSDMITFDDGTVGYTMEKLSGYDFARAGETGFNFEKFKASELTYLQRCQIMRDLFKQLNTLHKAGYCHGDINPANIKIEIDAQGNAHAKLFDFGQSKFIDSKKFLALSEAMGMPEFVAPESVGEHKQYGKSSDVYALAAIAGMMFTNDPNAFIEQKLAVRNELNEEGTVDNNVKTERASQAKYDIDAMFSGVKLDDIDTTLQKKLKGFVENIVGGKNSEPSKRPTSKEGFKFFEIMCKELEKQAQNEQKPKLA